MLSPATKLDLHRAQKSLLRAVATLEFVKGVFVLLIGICAILLVRKDVWVMAESLLALLHISTDRHSAQLFLDFADNLTDTRLWAAAKLAFVYSALRFVEGYGLWRQNCTTKAEMGGLWLRRLWLLPSEIRELRFRAVLQLRSPAFLLCFRHQHWDHLLYVFLVAEGCRQRLCCQP